MVKGAAGELAPTILDLRRKGYSYREIAQTLGVSTKLVYNVLHSTPDTENTGNTGATMPPTTPCTTDRVETHPGQPDTGDTPQTAGGATQTLKVEARETVETHWKHLETLGNVSGNTLETPRNSGKHHGNTWKHSASLWRRRETSRKHLETAGNTWKRSREHWGRRRGYPHSCGRRRGGRTPACGRGRRGRAVEGAGGAPGAGGGLPARPRGQAHRGGAEADGGARPRADNRSRTTSQTRTPENHTPNHIRWGRNPEAQAVVAILVAGPPRPDSPAELNMSHADMYAGRRFTKGVG